MILEGMEEVATYIRSEKVLLCGCTEARPCAEHIAPALLHPPLRSLSEVEAEAVARHNAYGWIRPDAETCHLCGRKAFATPVDGFVVIDCFKCQRPLCQECAEVDGSGGDDGSLLSQWECRGGCLPEQTAS